MNKTEKTTPPDQKIEYRMTPDQENPQTTEIVRRAEMDTSVYAADVDEYADVPDKIPYLSIDHNNGVFLNKADKTEVSKLKGIILTHKRSRIMFSGDKNSQAKFVCKSGDAKRGKLGTELTRKDEKAASEIPKNGACIMCKYAEWEGKTPPPCTENRELLWRNMEGEITVLQFHKTALPIINNALSAMKAKRENCSARFIEITLQRRTNAKKQVWFVPEVTIGEYVPIDLFNAIKKEKEAYLSTFKKQTPEVLDAD